MRNVVDTIFPLDPGETGYSSVSDTATAMYQSVWLAGARRWLLVKSCLG